MKILAGTSNKPRIAQDADNAAMAIDRFMENVQYISENVNDYISDEELKILDNASDILSFFDQAYSEDKGML